MLGRLTVDRKKTRACENEAWRPAERREQILASPGTLWA
jgi:hypothetical protein